VESGSPTFWERQFAELLSSKWAQEQTQGNKRVFKAVVCIITHCKQTEKKHPLFDVQFLLQLK
jgi:hypothetical protein